MIIVYLSYILALLLFCHNARLGQLTWERHMIVFCLVVPTVAICATPLGVVVLHIAVSLVIEMLRSILADWPQQQTVLVPA